jgi:hypothetical protein
MIALMMEASSNCETSVNFYQTTRRYNPEDSHLLCICLKIMFLRRIGFQGRFSVNMVMNWAFLGSEEFLDLQSNSQLLRKTLCHGVWSRAVGRVTTFRWRFCGTPSVTNPPAPLDRTCHWRIVHPRPYPPSP